MCQCRDEHWKEGTYDKDEHVKVIRAAATALFERYTKDSLGENIKRVLINIISSISVYFIPAVRIFLDRQMSDIKGIYAVTFLAVSVEVCYVLLPILKQFIGYKIRIEVMGFTSYDLI